MKRTHIYDMDGTIVCSLHRYRTIVKPGGKITIDLDHWIANEHRAYDDSLLPLAAQYQNDLSDPSTFVVIATARHLQVPDLEFIQDKLGVPDAIVSRHSRCDQRSGAQLKIEGLRQVFDQHRLHNTTKKFWEDNLSYLHKVCSALPIKGHFVPSAQGW